MRHPSHVQIFFENFTYFEAILFLHGKINVKFPFQEVLMGKNLNNSSIFSL